ncbi:MAG: DUF2975 domain-containing protein [Asticcacaulis sp.]|nr:DUF2975 domain-containing protein [Asticcacaulis sp.]
MTHRSRLIGPTRLALRIGMVLNIGFGAGVALLLAASLIMGDRFTAILLHADTLSQLATTTAGARCLMIVGILVALATHIILLALGRMAVSLASDDPFAAVNTSRLRTIGWALLGIQLLDFPVMAIRHYAPVVGEIIRNAGISPSGWLAVLMVFVLAHIFEKGTAMRDYLEETI